MFSSFIPMKSPFSSLRYLICLVLFELILTFEFRAENVIFIKNFVILCTSCRIVVPLYARASLFRAVNTNWVNFCNFIRCSRWESCLEHTSATRLFEYLQLLRLKLVRLIFEQLLWFELMVVYWKLRHQIEKV